MYMLCHYMCTHMYTVSSHNSNSQTFKLRVKNPRTIAYPERAHISVLSFTRGICDSYRLLALRLLPVSKITNIIVTIVVIVIIVIIVMIVIIVIICEKRTPFVQAFALQSSSRNSYPPPDLVLWKLMLVSVFFSGGMFFSQTLVTKRDAA